MPHDTIFAAILGTLLYLFIPQYFGYAAIALVLWLGFPVMRVVWRTTRDLREIPDVEHEECEDKTGDEKDEDKPEDARVEIEAEDKNKEENAREE